jgi:Anti-sigma factor NepR
MRTALAAELVRGMDDKSKSMKRSHRGEKPAAAGRKDERNGIDDPIQRAIGEKLRAVFDQVVQQPVPERFVELLRKLAEQEQQKK